MASKIKIEAGAEPKTPIVKIEGVDGRKAQTHNLQKIKKEKVEAITLDDD